MHVYSQNMQKKGQFYVSHVQALASVCGLNASSTCPIKCVHFKPINPILTTMCTTEIHILLLILFITAVAKLER